ncbi:MAG: DUF1800 domain-containing protein [Alphaproteobacteria bacterium]|nr:DUF1800 domain-containing protein [Alphaproteobacteria bacterium]
MPTRRFKLLVVLLGLALAAPAAVRADAPSDRQVLHLLNRIGFGPSAADVAHVKQVGIDRYIDEQLHPESIAEPPELTARLATLDTLKLDPAQLFAQYGPILPVMNGGAKPTPEEAKARRQRAQVIVREAQEGRLWRALYSRRQLQEAMVDFWYNHFNVFAGKGLDHLWVGNFEATAIRPHALGHFRDLLLATARHPAMLFYLDNQLNTAPGSPGVRGNLTGLNENYAREIMELHTLGVDGGYTQADVESLARILTGWGFDRRALRDGNVPVFAFEATRHDTAEKTFLGRTIQPTGESEGIEAIGMLASSPATAHHIAIELAQYFVADKPAPALVDRLAQRFRETDGDIAAVMKTLLTSRDFRDSAGQKYKTPYQYVLSAARAAGAEVNNPRPLLNTMARLGMPLYYCQTPDGYKNTEDSWLSPDATTLRIGFATGFGRGTLPLKAPPPPDQAAGETPPPQPQLVADQPPAKPQPLDPAPLMALLGSTLSDNTRATVAQAEPSLKAALVLGSPDFMRR